MCPWIWLLMRWDATLGFVTGHILDSLNFKGSAEKSVNENNDSSRVFVGDGQPGDGAAAAVSGEGHTASSQSQEDRKEESLVCCESRC